MSTLRYDWDLTAEFREDIGERADEFILSQAREALRQQNLTPLSDLRLTWREWTDSDVLSEQIRIGVTARRAGDWHAVVTADVAEDMADRPDIPVRRLDAS